MQTENRGATPRPWGSYLVCRFDEIDDDVYHNIQAREAAWFWIASSAIRNRVWSIFSPLPLLLEWEWIETEEAPFDP